MNYSTIQHTKIRICTVVYFIYDNFNQPIVCIKILFYLLHYNIKLFYFS